MYWYIVVVCLVGLMTGAQACCEPDQYTASYEGIFSIVNTSYPSYSPKRIDIEYKGSGFVDWSGGNVYQSIEAVFRNITPDIEESFEVSVKFGISAGKKIWVSAKLPFMSETCYGAELEDGIPKEYQCLLKNYKEVGDNTYTAPRDEYSLTEFIKVTDECAPVAMNASAYLGYSTQTSMSLTVTDLELGVDSVADSEVPEDCNLLERSFMIPQLDHYADSIASKLVKGTFAVTRKRALVNEGLKRLVRHIGETVKRFR